MKRDILSDVLRALHLRGAVFYQVNLPEDWAIEAPPMHEVASLLFPDVEHVMEYHVMAEGGGWAMLGGQAPVRLGTGDVVILPHGDAHVLSSNPALRPTRIDPAWMLATRDAPKPVPIVFHGQAEFTWGVPAEGGRNRVICGFLSCDRTPFHPLLASLPRLLHLPGSAVRRDAQMIQAAVQAAEQDAPGAAALLERASETMFIDALLRYLDSLPERGSGWLAGLRDRRIGRALALIHQSPARPWSVDDLAQAAGLSRSVFCARFLDLTG